jgi:hypothetical protein
LNKESLKQLRDEELVGSGERLPHRMKVPNHYLLSGLITGIFLPPREDFVFFI